MVPPHPFSSNGGERMALSLVSFTMRRNWYNVNATNNTFYIYVNGTYFQSIIAPGVYTTFIELAAAISTALNLTINGIAQIIAASVEYNPNKRLFQIQFAMEAGFTDVIVEIRCFAIKGGYLPAGVSIMGGFNDVNEILGGTPIRTLTTAANSLEGSLNGGVNTLNSKYPVSLNTLDAIYLHMNTVSTGNFMSSGYESHIADSLRLVESSIFARIPFNDSTFTDVHEVVSFEDSGGDMYQSFINRSNIETLDIRVTDARGRSLATLNPDQAIDGLLGFRLCLRWDLFAAPHIMQPPRNTKLEQPPKM
jgi:hypothetical protein